MRQAPYERKLFQEYRDTKTDVGLYYFVLSYIFILEFFLFSFLKLRYIRVYIKFITATNLYLTYTCFCRNHVGCVHYWPRTMKIFQGVWIYWHWPYFRIYMLKFIFFIHFIKLTLSTRTLHKQYVLCRRNGGMRVESVNINFAFSIEYFESKEFGIYIIVKVLAYFCSSKIYIFYL